MPVPTVFSRSAVRITVNSSLQQLCFPWVHPAEHFACPFLEYKWAAHAAYMASPEQFCREVENLVHPAVFMHQHVFTLVLVSPTALVELKLTTLPALTVRYAVYAHSALQVNRYCPGWVSKSAAAAGHDWDCTQASARTAFLSSAIETCAGWGLEVIECLPGAVAAEQLTATLQLAFTLHMTAHLWQCTHDSTYSAYRGTDSAV